MSTEDFFVAILGVMTLYLAYGCVRDIRIGRALRVGRAAARPPELDSMWMTFISEGFLNRAYRGNWVDSGLSDAFARSIVHVANVGGGQQVADNAPPVLRRQVLAYPNRVSIRPMDAPVPRRPAATQTYRRHRVQHA